MAANSLHHPRQGILPTRAILKSTVPATGESTDGFVRELGLVADLTSGAVIPHTGQPLTAQAAAKMTWPHRDEPELGLVLLAATATDEGLQLTLGRAPVTRATLEAADADVWTPIAELPHGATEVTLPVALVREGTAPRSARAAALAAALREPPVLLLLSMRGSSH